MRNFFKRVRDAWMILIGKAQVKATVCMDSTKPPIEMKVVKNSDQKDDAIKKDEPKKEDRKSGSRLEDKPRAPKPDIDKDKRDEIIKDDITRELIKGSFAILACIGAATHKATRSRGGKIVAGGFTVMALIGLVAACSED
jgi:hypothetical protein